MSRYFLPLGRAAAYPHPAPERTASRAGRSVFADSEFRSWPSRRAMIEACRMGGGWKPLVKPQGCRHMDEFSDIVCVDCAPSMCDPLNDPSSMLEGGAA